MAILSQDYGSILIGCSIVLAILAIVVAASVPGRINPYSVGLLLGAALWSLFHGLEALMQTQIQKRFWSDMQYAALAGIPFYWVAFCLRVAGDRAPRLPSRLWPYVAFFAFEATLAATNRWTGAMFSYLDPLSPGTLALKTRNWGFWLCTSVLLVSSIHGSLALLRANRNGGLDPWGKRRVVAFLIALLLPLAFGILDIFHISPITGFNLGPLSLSVSIIVIGYGFLSLRLLSPVPLAHRALIDGMKDPVIVVDERRWAVYGNAAAAAIAKSAALGRRGSPLSEFLPELAATGSRADAFLVRIENTEYEVSVSPVSRRGGTILVQLYLLRDVTAMRAEKAHLEELVQDRTIQLREANLALEDEVGRYQDAHRRLESLLAEKEVLIKEIHHRTKNGLQIVSSILALQSHRIKDPAIIAAFQSMRNRIRSISLVHEKLHGVSTRESIDLGEYTRDLVRQLATSFGEESEGMRIEVEAESIRSPMDFCADFGLMLTELVTNSFRHSLMPRGNGLVQVALSRDGDGAVAVVQDDGPGYPSGLCPETVDSLGFHIVNSFGRKWGCELLFSRSGPARAEIRIPAKAVMRVPVLE